jgi:hypothetical protein
MDRTPVADATAPQDRLVYLEVKPAWAYIDGVGELGRFFGSTKFPDADVGDRMRIVVHEALENAVKYSAPDADDDVSLAISTDGSSIEVAVTSRPRPEHLAQLRAELDELYTRPAEEAYVAAMARAASRPASEGARLGLARMRLEGRVDLSIETLQAERIRLVCRGPL